MIQAMHHLSGGIQALVPLVETSTTTAQSLLVREVSDSAHEKELQQSTEVSIRETSAHSHMVSERLANALIVVNDSLASITSWRNEIGSRSPWRLSLFSGEQSARASC